MNSEVEMEAVDYIPEYILPIIESARSSPLNMYSFSTSSYPLLEISCWKNRR